MATQREPDRFYIAVRNPDVYELLSRRIRDEGRGWLIVGRMPHSGDEAVAVLKAERPRFTLIDSRLRNCDGFQVAEAARDLDIGFSVLIAPGDTEGMGRALRLGAADTPTSAGEEELFDVIRRHLQRSAQRLQIVKGVAARPAGLIYAFIPSESGVGNSTFMASALVRLQKHWGPKGKRVIGVDLDMAGGKLAELLGFGHQCAQRIVGNAVVDGKNLLTMKKIETTPWTADTLKPYTMRALNGTLEFLASPRSRFCRNDFLWEDIKQLFLLLEEEYDVTAVDVGPENVETMMSVITVADCTVITAEPSMSSLDGVMQILEYCKGSSVDPSTIKVVLNKAPKKLPNDLTLESIQRQCLDRYKVSLLRPIPYVPWALETANKGVPIEANIPEKMKTQQAAGELEGYREALVTMWEQVLGFKFPRPEAVKDKSSWSAAFRIFDSAEARKTLSHLTPPPLPRGREGRFLEEDGAPIEPLE